MEIQNLIVYRIKSSTNGMLVCTSVGKKQQEKKTVLYRMWLSPAKRCSLPTVFNLPIFQKNCNVYQPLKALAAKQANLTKKMELKIFF